MSIHGVIQDGSILPLDPIPPEWNGREVLIEASEAKSFDERAQIEKWYADMEALGSAQYEPGEREAIEKLMADADRDAKEYVRRSWAQFDDILPRGHESPERDAER